MFSASNRPASGLFAATLGKPLHQSQLFDTLVTLLSGERFNAAAPTVAKPKIDAAMAAAHPLRILLWATLCAASALVVGRWAVVPALGYAAALTRRLRAANERISRQSFQTVPSRVAGVLLQLASEEADENSGHEVTIRMNQADLAQLAGTSRESVSRFLADLDRAGVVRAGRGRVTIIDSAKLRNYIF